MFDTHELAWAAGFFDGEGCTVAYEYTPKDQIKPYRVISLSVSQVNVHPLERFHKAIIGLGVINGPFIPKQGQVKPQYKYRVSGFERVQAIISMLWPWLCDNKRKQARVALLSMHNNIRSVGHPIQQYCLRGHDLGMTGRIRPNGDRTCRDCERLHSLASYYRRIGDFDEVERVLNGTHVSRKSWRRKDIHHD